MDLSDAHSIKRAGGCHCTEGFPALWKLLPLSLHHYSPYKNLFVNISREGGVNTVRKLCLSSSRKTTAVRKNGKSPFLRSYDAVSISNYLFF